MMSFLRLRFMQRLLSPCLPGAIIAAVLLVLAAPAAHATTTTTVTSSANPSNYTTNITLTATITGGPGATGTVTFLDGTATLGSSPVMPGPVTATYMTSTLGAGTHMISAVYSGDGSNSGSTSAIFNQVINAHGTSTTLAVSANPIAYGSTLGLVATVVGATPTGTVTFKDSAGAIGSATLSAMGTASFSLATLSAGAHTLTAVYAGDGNNLASTSVVTNETVSFGTTSTTLVSSLNPAPFGQSVQFTANVIGGTGATGTMQFRDNGNVVSTQPVIGGAANFSTSALAIGSHTMTAVYSGDSNRAGSTGTVTQVIGAGVSTTVLSTSLNPSPTGQLVTFTATVTGSNSPSGTINFKDGATVIGTASLAGGAATYATSSLTAGTHIMTAVYSGDTNNQGGTSASLNQVISTVPVAIISSRNPSSAGQSVTFTVTVTGAGPTGSVTIFDSGNALSSATLAGGVATYTTSTLSVGTHSINARYGGDTNNPSAFSSILTQTVSGTVVPQTGLWWNPAEGGRGYTIEQRGNNLFMATYLYDASGRSTWYGLGPGPIVNGTYQGSLLSYSGGQTLTGAYQPATQSSTGGFATVTFSTPTQGTLTWPEGTIPIQKFDFGPGGSAAVQPVGTPEPGWWWAPNEGGRGYSIEIQGGVMYLAAYMYDAQGNPVWYASGPANMTGLMTYQGTWQQYGNGQTLTGTWHPAQVTNSNAGSVTIQFSSTTAAMLTFPDGRQVAIERFAF
jgi:hypothetical protein